MDQISVSEHPRREDGKVGSAKRAEIMGRIGSRVIVVLLFLLPLFFVPSSFLSLAHLKGLLLYLGTAAAFLFWALSRMARKKIIVPRSPVYAFFFIIPAIYAISAFLAPSSPLSFFGYGFEQDTFLTVSVLFFLGALVPLLFQKKLSSLRLFGAVYIGFFLLLLFHLLEVIAGVDLFSLLGVGELFYTPIGSWNDLALFSGVVGIMSLVALEFLPAGRPLKVFCALSLFAALVVVGVVNATLVWMLLFVVATVLGLIKLLSQKINERRKKKRTGILEKKPWLSLTITVIALFFVVGSTMVSGFTQRMGGVTYTDVAPSWGETFVVAGSVLREDPLFGAGPNRFSFAWDEHKPLHVNESSFWQASFSSGVGYIPTQLVMVGLVGIFAWLAFIATLLFIGARVVLHSLFQKPTLQFVSVSLFLSTVFLWLASVFTNPSIAVLALATTLSGAVMAKAHHIDVIKSLSLSYEYSKRMKALSTTLLVLLLLTVLFGGIFLVNRVQALKAYNDASLALMGGETDQVREYLLEAQDDLPSDLFARSLARLNLSVVHATLQTEEEISPEGVRDLTTKLQESITYGRQALRSNRNSALNWVVLADVYATLARLGIDGAAQEARKYLEEAEVYAPHDPTLSVAIADMYLLEGDRTNARESILDALEKKHDFMPAYHLLARVEAGEGNTDHAIAILERARTHKPDDFLTLTTLGVLYYETGDYMRAIDVLRSSVLLEPDDPEVHSYLAVAYAEVGDRVRAYRELDHVRSLGFNVTNIEERIEGILDASVDDDEGEGEEEEGE